MTVQELVVPIEQVRWRELVTVQGSATALRVVPWAEQAPVLECTVHDDTGGLTLVFLGRRTLPGLELGRRVRAHGRLIEVRGRLAIMNPAYDLLP